MVTKEILKYGDRSVVEVKDDLGQIKKYVTCTNYDATKEYGNQWIWGHYYDVWENGKEEEMLKGAIMELYEVKTEEKNQTIPPIRMQEIAEKVIAYIKNNLDTDDVKDYLEDAELTEEEAEYFGVKKILYPQNYKIVRVKLIRKQETEIRIAVPEDDEYYDAEDYIPEMNYLDPDDDGYWEVDETFEDSYVKSRQDVLDEYDSDDLYNYEAIRCEEY